MIEPKKHIRDLYRTPPDTESRRQYVLRLDKNDRVVSFPAEIMARFHQLLDEQAVMMYPEIEPLYEKLAEYLGVDRSHLFLAAGSDLAIKTIFETYVSAGDRVQLHMPSYALYEIYSAMFQAEVATLSFNRRLELDVEAFIDKITPETRLVALENPNGFTGTVLPRSAIRAIAEKAHKCNAILLLDEVYYLFTGDSMLPLYREFDNVIIVRSFSKDFGMAGLRCGYLLSQPRNIDFLYRVKPMYEVSTAAVAFCLAVLEFPGHLDRYVNEIRDGVKFAKNELQKMGFSTGGGHGNFFLVYLGEGIDIPAFIDKLKHRNVLVRRPFQVETIKGWLRVAAGNVAQMEKFVHSFGEVLKEMGWAKDRYRIPA